MTDTRSGWTASAAAAGLAGVAAFQVALALGAPLGHAAWGGAYTVLPAGLRAGSAASALFMAGAALTLFTYGRRARPAPPAHRWAARVLGVLLALSALANFASPSRWENYLMGPIALALSVLCLVATAGPRTGRLTPEVVDQGQQRA
ncbi:hypothetical protein [Dactylosporangium sp. CA-139066]|uniref:hypothetical protein n=1 Tax=Dactylosporangium sp. CA-139066 TaxID=3239930 RepID=UPI003D8CBDC9